MTEGVHERPRRSTAVWEWAQAALLIVNLTWTTLCLGGYRAETMVVTSALTGLLLVVHLFGFVIFRPTAGDDADRVLRVHPAGWWLLPFLVYAAANVQWITPVRWLGWQDWLGWAQMIAVFWVVLNGVRSREARATLFGSLVALAFGAAVLGCYQRFARPDWLMLGRTQADQFIGRASGPFGIPNSLAAVLLLVVFPVAALAFRRGASAVRRVLFGYLAAVLMLGLVLTISRGAWLAVVVVAAVWPLVNGRGAVRRRLLITGGATVGLMLVVAGLFFAVPLVRERLTSLKTDLGERTRPIMWRGAWKIFQEHPAWGGGAGSYNIRFEKHRPERYQDTPRWAHNEYLNTLSDYGATGFALFFGAAGAIGWRCVRKVRRVKRIAGEDARGWRAAAKADDLPLGAATAGLAAFALQMGVDFHLKLPALAMAFAVVSALVVQRAWPGRFGAAGKSAALERDFCVIAGTFVVAGSIWFVNPLYRAEALRANAREAIDRLAVRNVAPADWQPTLANAVEGLTQATELDAKNGAVWADVSYVSALLAQIETGAAMDYGKKAERFADTALACSRLVPEFWVRRGVALDLQGRRVEAGGPFVEALRLAPANAVYWYYQAVHLSLDETDPGRALAAVTFCLRLDPGKREAQALRRRLADRTGAP